MEIFLAIFCFLLIIYAFLIDYYRKSWNQIPEFLPAKSIGNTFVSIIIPVRNEEKNLEILIGSLKEQRYPSTLFEVIIVDDHSTDNTWKLLNSIPPGSITIKPLLLSDWISGNNEILAHKKLAIEKGIAQAQGKLIVTTDADCVFNPAWLVHIVSFYEATKAKFIAAPVKYSTNNTFLSIFQALDFMTLQGITGASVHKRFHTMCNGANLAYEKSSFIEVDGFYGIDNIASGDDMLLMYKIYKKFPEHVLYCKSNQAIVITSPMNTWKDFFYQRIRWASKATHYDDQKIFWILLLVYGINFCFLALAIASFWNYNWLLFLPLFLMVKVIIEFPFVNSVANFFQEKKLLKYFPLMQPFHVFYTIVAGWLGKFGSYEWKGRRIKQ